MIHVLQVVSNFVRVVKSRATAMADRLYEGLHWNQIDRQAGVGTLQGVAFASMGAVAGGIAAQPEILGDAISNLLSNILITSTLSFVLQ